MNNSILYISYEFPPCAGAGVQRATRHVDFLLKNGYKVTVLTSSHFNYNDNSIKLSCNQPNLKLLPVHDYLERLLILLKSNFIRKLFSYIMFPDRRLIWALSSCFILVHRFKNYGTIVTSSHPYSSHFIGLFAKILNPRIKWIVDYRDAWTNNPSLFYSKKEILFSSFNKFTESYINKRCDKIITVSENLKNYIIFKNKNKIDVVYNAFNKTDFNKEIKPKKNEKFSIFYMGSLYYERNPQLIIKPLIKLLSLDISILQKINLTIIGHNDLNFIKNEFKFLNDNGLNVEVSSYQPHDKALICAQKSDLLLLLIDETYGSDAVVTGKLLEYINMSIPILGIVPEKSEAESIILKSNSGYVFYPWNNENICRFLYDQINTSRSNKPVPLKKNYNYINSFEKSRQCANFVKIIRDVLQ